MSKSELRREIQARKLKETKVTNCFGKGRRKACVSSELRERLQSSDNAFDQACPSEGAGSMNCKQLRALASAAGICQGDQRYDTLLANVRNYDRVRRKRRGERRVEADRKQRQKEMKWAENKRRQVTQNEAASPPEKK